MDAHPVTDSEFADWCIHCGACVIARKTGDCLNMDARQSYPVPTPSGKCIECGLCVKVCPAAEVDYTSLIQDKQPCDPYLGPVANCWLSSASDQSIRHSTASGGTATALSLFALEKGLVDGVLIVADGDSPLTASPRIAVSRQQILAGAGSKYFPSPILLPLREWADKKDARIMFVGLPCQIHALRKLQATVPWMRRRVSLAVGLFCSGMPSAHGYGFLLKKRLGLSLGSVLKTPGRRGEGQDGKIRFILAGGKEKRLPTSSFGAMIPFFKQRCFLCADYTAEMSDISLGDAWIPEVVASRSPHNVAIVRTSEGTQMLSEAIKAGYVKAREISPSVVRQSQKSGLNSKKVGVRLRRKWFVQRPEDKVNLPDVAITLRDRLGNLWLRRRIRRANRAIAYPERSTSLPWRVYALLHQTNTILLAGREWRLWQIACRIGAIIKRRLSRQ